MEAARRCSLTLREPAVIEKETKTKSMTIRVVSAELKDKKEELTEARELVEKNSESNKELRRVVRDLEDKMLEMEKELRNTSEELTVSSKWLMSSRKGADHLAAELKKARRQSNAKEGRLTALLKESHRFESLAEEQRKALTGYKLEMVSSSISLSRMSSEVNDMANGCRQDEENIRNLAKEVDKLREEGYRDNGGLRKSLRKTRQRCHRLTKRLARARGQIHDLSSFKREIIEMIRLTQIGVYSPQLHALVCRLVILGVPVSKCSSVILELMKFTCKFMGIRRKEQNTRFRIPSVRTIRRIVLEGGVASKLQLGHELKLTKGEYSPYPFCCIW